jgi:predicted Zn-dependent protease
LILEVAAAVAAAALLFGIALVVQKLFLSGPVRTPDIPLAVETSLRTLMLSQVRAEQRIIDTPAVTDAFAGIEARLIPKVGALPYQVQVLVVDSPVVTMPGGLIVVYSGLARRMESPEEMAAILAHELGHVVHRDSLTLIARQLGIAALLTILTGGRGENLAQSALRTLVTRHYSRGAEDSADAFAEELLPRAGMDPAAFAFALARLKKREGGDTPALLQYLDPHSAIEQRIARARAAAKPAGFRASPIRVDWKKAVAALPGAAKSP